MSFRFKFWQIITFVFFLLTINCSLVYAAWWQVGAIPVPSDTEETKKETRSIGSSDIDFSYYTSDLPVEEIKEFYRQKLALSGWQEKDLMRDIKQIPDIQGISSSFNKNLENNLIFEKGEEMLILTFMPQDYIGDGKTRYTLSKGKIAAKEGAMSTEDLIPKLNATPKKDVAPTYPGAALMTLSEQPLSLRATYFTKDNLETVTTFYKEKMPSYGWNLIEETPPKKMEYGAINKPEYCPSCAKENNITSKPIDIWAAEMGFSNSRRDICRIILSHASSTQESLHSLEMTTIMVSYDERKE